MKAKTTKVRLTERQLEFLLHLINAMMEMEFPDKKGMVDIGEGKVSVNTVEITLQKLEQANNKLTEHYKNNH